MTELKISFEDGLVRQGLEDLAGEFPKIGRRRIYDMVNRITRTMEAYPPERAGQSRIGYHLKLGRVFIATGYRRTGKLGRSWKVDRNDDGYSIRNTAERNGHPYPRFVVGDAYGTGQAWMHRGRWLVFRDVVDKEVEKLPKEVADEVVMVARRKGFQAS
jgi:hypothetical protein